MIDAAKLEALIADILRHDVWDLDEGERDALIAAAREALALRERVAAVGGYLHWHGSDLPSAEWIIKEVIGRTDWRDEEIERLEAENAALRAAVEAHNAKYEAECGRVDDGEWQRCSHGLTPRSSPARNCPPCPRRHMIPVPGVDAAGRAKEAGGC